jgi:2-dehydro-3-deoxyphosphooctonate aldolase (KDO 8-P synthase)
MNHFQPLQEPVVLEANGTKITWGRCDQWALFAGPDIFEDEGMVLEVAQELKRVTTALGIPWILKCSYDKANRQSGQSFRGPGKLEGLKGLERVKSKVGCLLLSDVHETTEVEPAAEVLDVIQIPAFLSRQTDLIVAAAKTGKVLHIKKGQFLAPGDMKHVITKAEEAGNRKILLCERGTFFGYGRLVNDYSGMVDMRMLGKPVIYDASHSTQLPGAGAGSKSSGGRSDMSWPLARAALALGIDGLFLETHPRPETALCDGPSSFPLGRLEAMLTDLQNVWKTHQALK